MFYNYNMIEGMLKAYKILKENGAIKNEIREYEDAIYNLGKEEKDKKEFDEFKNNLSEEEKKEFNDCFGE